MELSSKWKEITARAGYSAKTVMYVMLGVFILTSVFTALNREKASQSNVFITLKEQPLGQIFLGVLVFGLVCYACWRWLQIFTWVVEQVIVKKIAKQKRNVNRCRNN